jgi:transketolase
MRNAFADELLKLARQDSRVAVLSGDIGNRLFDKFKAEFPDRFYNCGVAEANLISMAAGMASCGMRPIGYTITPFITTRCLEQIKVDVCYHGMPVLIVGTGSGLSYSSLGSTHHSFEDLAIMRVLPGMSVLAPADSGELRSCMRAALQQNGPAYIRIGKKGEPVIFPEPPPVEIGKWNIVEHGDRVCILSCGTLLPVALAAAALLRDTGLQPRVVRCASVKPLDTDFLAHAAANSEVLVTMEEHSLIGGFGSAVAEFLLDANLPHPPRLLRAGIPDHFLHDCGEQDHARSLCGLDAPSIANRIQELLAP